MKKLIGIILAICMLSTMAFAAEITDAAATATGTTVNVTYTALANNAQATMLAYKVADTATADDEKTLAYVDQTTTPIVGIDQEASDGTFEFKLADGFKGKIVIKVGGADVTTPDTVLLLDFFETEEPVKTLNIIVGDVNMDGTLNATDSAYLALWTAINPRPNFDNKREELKTQLAALNYNIKAGEVYVLADNSGSVIIGDVNMDGTLNATDSAYLALWTAINPRPNFDNKREELKTQLAGLNYNIKAGESKTVNEK